MNFLFLLVLLLISTASAHKFLVYNSKFGHSHTNFMARIADILAESGHEVISLMPTIDPKVRDTTKLSKIIHVERSAATASMHDEFMGVLSELFASTRLDPLRNYRNGQLIGRIFASQCRALLDEPGLIELLQREKFDVMLVEYFDSCGTALVELIKPTAFIAVSTGPIFGSAHGADLGIPAAHSYNPASSLSRFDVHSMWDRALNLYAEWAVSLIVGAKRKHMDALFQEKYGAEFPAVREILSRSAYIFVNSEPLLDFASPTISKVIYIPGMGAQQPKKLDGDWEKLLTKRSRAVLISFGSMMKSVYLPMEVRTALVETVKALPDVTFIWKYEEDDEFARNVGSKIDNLVLTKWMPQVDILHHKNVRAFVTHGGMGSTQETAMRGVPGIFVPIFAEQPRNAGMMEHNGLGKVLSKYELANASKIIEIVREVLDNPLYYTNAQRVAAMLKSKPFKSREQLVKYTEFAAEFGPSAALRPQSHDMNWIEYHNVDVFAVVFLLVLAIGLIAFKMLWIAASRWMIPAKFKRE